MNVETRLAEIRDGIIRTRKKDLYRSIVFELIDNDGDLDTAPTLFQDRWVAPSERDLEAVVAAKVNAAVDHCTAQYEHLLAADEASKAKVDKFTEMLARVQADADDTGSVAAIMAELDEFKALAAHLSAEPAPPSGSTHAARAGSASGKGK